MTLASFLTSLFSGGLTYTAAGAIFAALANLAGSGLPPGRVLSILLYVISPQGKRLASFPICLLITLGALLLAAALNYLAITPDTAFQATVVAYTTSQFIHAAELRTQPVPVNLVRRL